MIKIENVVLPSLAQWESVIIGMRNPMNSWEKSDTVYEGNYPKIGSNDLSLMERLRAAGHDHSKFMRMIPVYADVIQPLYWWKEFDTYKVGTVVNSCSTMHKIAAKEFTLDDFSHEHLISEYNIPNYFVPDHDVEKAEIRCISDFPDYEVSEYGDVYSLKTGKRVLLKQQTDIDGYKVIGLYKEGICKRQKVHRLVADALLDKVEGKDYVNHKDGNKWNNSKTNLEWCTRQENSKHASENGLLVYGSKQKIGKAKKRRFTDEQIAMIKKLYFSDKMSQRKIGEMFGCDHSVISEIVNEKIYKKIELKPLECLEQIIETLNDLREKYLETNDKELWYSMIQLLPSSYNQRRTIFLNYEVLANMYHSRKNHKLDEWRTFCKWIETLPFSELITGGKDGNE